MKAICLILAVYVFVLTSHTCCNEENCDNEVIIEQTSNSHSGHDSDNQCNNCSPFFTCGSCTGFIVDLAGIVLKPSVIANGKQNLPYYTGWINDYFSEFWQPPKIS